MIKHSLILTSILLFTGCSTKIQVNNIDNNSLIKNKNESVLVSSLNNDIITKNFVNEINKELHFDNIYLNPPYDYEINLRLLNHYTNIENYEKNTELYIKEDMCNNIDFNNKDNKNIIFNKDKVKYTYIDKNNKVNEYCYKKIIKTETCYKIETISNLNFTSKINELHLNDYITYNEKSYKEYCNINIKDNNILENYKKDNIDLNTNNLKKKLLDYIRPNIDIISLSIYQNINSFKITKQENDAFDNINKLIEENKLKKALEELLILSNYFDNKYNKIPFEINFNIALIYESLKEYDLAKEYYSKIKDINIEKHIERINKITTFYK